MRPLLKICGVNDAAFAARAAELGADYLGLIFAAKSPRRVDAAQAREIVAAVKARRGPVPGFVGPVPSFVGVFTNHGPGEIAAIAREIPLDVVQLHGAYGDAAVAALKAAGLEIWRLFDGGAPGPEDAVLLDGRDGASRGGTGKLADWSRVAALKAAGRRVVLAGRLSPENVREAAATGADVLDVNSSLETAPSSPPSRSGERPLLLGVGVGFSLPEAGEDDRSGERDADRHKQRETPAAGRLREVAEHLAGDGHADV